MRVFGLVLLLAPLASAQLQIYEGELDGRPITFRIHEGQALYQDDIVLGPATKPNGQRNTSFFIGNLWPGGLIPYEIDPTFPATTLAQLQQAINTWNAYGTPIRLQPRAGETDYARFVRSPLTTGVCSSAVGRRGGSQTVTLEDGCTAPAIIHEIGHTVGMWHEQSRIDRNFNVTVLYENIAKTLAGNYSIEATGQDLAGYEYGSSMHYRPFSFNVDGRLAMESVPPGIPMGETSGMNAGDLDAVSRKYGVVPTQTTIASNPPGLTIEVDGQAVVTPRVFNWAPGSPHVIAVPADPQTVSGLRYSFGKWSDGGQREHSFDATGGVAVYTAHFIRRVPLVVTQQAGGTVSVDPPIADGFYSTYAQIVLTATPAPGYRFYRWQSAGAFACGGLTTSDNPLILPKRPTGYGCTALFTQLPMTTVQSSPPGRTVAVDGVAYTAPVNFLFLAGSQHTLGASTPAVGFASRFLFSGWSDGGDAVHPYTALPEGGVVTARFTKQYLLTLQQPSPLAGRLIASPTSLDGFYDEGTVVSIQTSFNAPFTLFSWSNDLTGRSDPATVTMDNQHLVAATPTSGTPPFIVLNALTFRAASIAPGQIVSLFGSALGPATETGPVINAAGRVATESGRVRVFFDGIPAPVLYASAGQVNVVVPYGLASSGVTRVVAEYNGVATTSVNVPLTPVNPSIVSNGVGGAVVVNQDGSFNGPNRPAHRGSVIVFFASGEGATLPAGVDGRVGANPLARPAQSVSVRVGGRVADLLYAGNAPNFVAGAMQVNARIPADSPTGEVSLYLMVGTAASPPITKIFVD
jgi:uncharacterized protein (TIGR03437 family)